MSSQVSANLRLGVPILFQGKRKIEQIYHLRFSAVLRVNFWTESFFLRIYRWSLGKLFYTAERTQTMGIESERELMERVIASAIVSVGTRYVVEVERELLVLRLEISEKGNSLGNVEVIEAVGERLRIVHDRMNGFSGDMYRLLSEVKREIGKITGTKNFGNSDDVQKKRGRPSKNTEAKRDEA